MKELNTISRVEAIEQVASLFIAADALVVDLANAPGYPDMMVLVKDCMPLFIFVRPDDVESADWKAAKSTVEKNLAAVNATWFDASEVSDLDWVLGEVLHRTRPGNLVDSLPAVQLTAEQSGFEKTGMEMTAEQAGFEFEPTGASEASAGTQTPATPEAPQRDRKAWLA